MKQKIKENIKTAELLKYRWSRRTNLKGEKKKIVAYSSPFFSVRNKNSLPPKPLLFFLFLFRLPKRGSRITQIWVVVDRKEAIQSILTQWYPSRLPSSRRVIVLKIQGGVRQLLLAARAHLVFPQSQSLWHLTEICHKGRASWTWYLAKQPQHRYRFRFPLESDFDSP